MDRAACWDACRQKTPDDLSSRSVLRTWPRKSVLKNAEKLNSKVVGKCGSDVTRLRQTGPYALRRMGIFDDVRAHSLFGGAAAICTIFSLGREPYVLSLVQYMDVHWTSCIFEMDAERGRMSESNVF